MTVCKRTSGQVDKWTSLEVDQLWDKYILIMVISILSIEPWIVNWQGNLNSEFIISNSELMIYAFFTLKAIISILRPKAVLVIFRKYLYFVV